MDGLLYKNKYLQQQFQLNQQKEQQKQKQQQQQNFNSNFIHIDNTGLQLASKLRLLKENLEKNCDDNNNSLKASQPISGEFFDYQKSRFNFSEDQFSDCLSQTINSSEDANSTIIESESQMMMMMMNRKSQENQQQQQRNDSFSSSTTLSSLLVSRINNGSNSVGLTPPDSLKLNSENGVEMRKKYQIEKHYSIYSEDSLCKPLKIKNLTTQQQELQEATYSDNISRQSSIRSLISLDKKISEMAVRKQMIQQKFLNQPAKFLTNNGNNNNNQDNRSNSSQFDDNERLLLLNWENYDEVMSQSSSRSSPIKKNNKNELINSNNKKFMSLNEYQKKQEQLNRTNSENRRPETRLGFRPDEIDNESYTDDYSVKDLNNRNNILEDTITDTESHTESHSNEKNIPKPLPFQPPPLTPQQRPVTASKNQQRSSNARDSERRKTTSDLLTTIEATNQQNKQKSLLLEPQAIGEKLLTRNAISDLNVANFDMNLDDAKFKQNNYFNGIYDNYNEINDNKNQDKHKRYQALSASINKIFTDLFENFEKNKTDGTNSLLLQTINKTQHQLNDSHSNKDSGFIQEYNSPQQSKPSSSSTTKNQQNLRSEVLQQEKQQIASKPTKIPKPTNQSKTAATNKDVSLLERYLNSEQQVSYKYRQIISILDQAYCENGNLIEDYSLAEYILNQEGISFQTFQQSIREKYQDFEWNDILLAHLFQIINTESITQNQSLDPRYLNNNNNSNNENYPNSLTSSQTSKSYRKVKDLKQASQQKRSSKLIQQQLYNYEDDYIVEDSLNESLNRVKKNQKPEKPDPNSSLVESCGIIMKTDGWRKEIEDYFDTQSASKQKEKRTRKGSLPEAKLNYMTQPTKANSSSSNHTSNQHRSRKVDDDASSYSQKHQNAFILEILRTSMFRSKSASDLRNSSTRSSNKSLNKIETGHIFNINTSLIQDSYTENSDSDNKLCNYYKHSESCTKCLNLTSEQIDSYRGLIWQCADMCYSEFTQKYEELLWLLDGGNFSIQSKLKVYACHILMVVFLFRILKFKLFSRLCISWNKS